MYVVIHRNNTPGKKEITGKNERRRRRKRYGQSCLCLKANIVRVMKSKRLRWAGHVTRIEEDFQNLADKTIGKRPFGRPRRRWEDKLERTLKLYVSKREIG